LTEGSLRLRKGKKLSPDKENPHSSGKNERFKTRLRGEKKGGMAAQPREFQSSAKNGRVSVTGGGGKQHAVGKGGRRKGSLHRKLLLFGKKGGSFQRKVLRVQTGHQKEGRERRMYFYEKGKTFDGKKREELPTLRGNLIPEERKEGSLYQKDVRIAPKKKREESSA